jgi:uncharacterized membrane protein
VKSEWAERPAADAQLVSGRRRFSRTKGLDQMKALLARMRTHVVTGFIFIMPVLVSLAVILRFWTHLLRVGGKLSKVLFLHSVLGPAGDAVMAVVFFVFICVVAGYLVRVSFLKQTGERIDQRLGTLIPGYSQLRAEARKKVGVETERQPSFDACLVKVQGLWQPAYVIEKNPDGSQTVFVPEAPLGAHGWIYVAYPGQLRHLGIDSGALNNHLRQFGKGMMAGHGSWGDRH